MWNIFKRKKKTENEKDSLSFPFLLTYAHKFIISWLMAKENISHEKAMAQIFNRGCHELAKNCALEHLTVPPTQENAVQMSQTQPAPSQNGRKTKMPFTTCGIPHYHLRFATYFNGNLRMRMARFCNRDSRNLIKEGYQTYALVFEKDKVLILLFKNGNGTRRLRRRFTEKHEYLMLCGEPVRRIDKALSLNPDKPADIPFLMQNGIGCLILRIYIKTTH